MYKHMDLDNIFSLFASNSNLVNEESSKVYIDLTNTPIYWVGMYKKIIENNQGLNYQFIQLIKKSTPELDEDEIIEAGEFYMFNRAFSFIKKIDMENEEHLEAIKKYTDSNLEKILKNNIKFFEKHELYEKCSVLKKVLDFSTEFQK